MANNQIPEEPIIRSPLPLYQSIHTPPSTIGCQHTGSGHPSHCHAHAPYAQPCHHGEAIGEGSRANVVPLPMLGRWPALVECPGCRGVAPTTTDHTIGKGTHWMAVLLFCTTGLGVFIPYSMKPFKNVRHNCLRCGRTLATRRFGGGTKAHLM
ncbi:litaf-like zinc finger domain-containing protein [Colletotrichum truncatum]|uniref:Litaf-like zinc finger domain-containing protein n=1 Tax=Colletotrichum truncatum TaxID=5467 RepID=A0ACC3Z2K2_COLTU